MTKKQSKNVSYKEMAKAISKFTDLIDNWNKGSGITFEVDRLLGRKGTWWWPEGDEKTFKKELKKLLDCDTYTVSGVGFGFWEHTSVYVSITFKNP